MQTHQRSINITQTFKATRRGSLPGQRDRLLQVRMGGV